LARLKQERATLEARVRFEQFFTPELARSLAECPGMLDGRDVEVTVLFADVRGYSAVSEKLGPAGTVEWIRDVLGALSACVLDEGGVLVDYIGDELMAMWGVPAEQPDHAARACRAALAMRAQVPVLNERWQPRVGATQGAGIGVHTGMARVGNVGTPQKFKYSALGHTVNLASRVQGATKYLRRPLLITGATRAHLSDDLPARRLTKVRVVNIRAAVDLYELVSGPPPGWAELRDGYEAALTAFEANNLESAARMLAGLLDAYRDDGPSLLLLSRAVNALLPGSPAFDPVWELPGK
jgi:adenylate cyclase